MSRKRDLSSLKSLMSFNLKNKHIWYKIESRHANSVNQFLSGEFIHLCEAIKAKSELTESADSLTLQVKHETDSEYNIILNADYFRNECNNSFKKLVDEFGIKVTNPIKVTLPGMFHFVYFSFFPV